jgi:hypothetical protein
MGLRPQGLDQVRVCSDLAVACDAADLSVGQDPGVPDCSVDADLVSPDAAARIENVLKKRDVQVTYKNVIKNL